MSRFSRSSIKGYSRTSGEVLKLFTVPDVSVTCNKRVNVRHFMIDKLSFKVCNYRCNFYTVFEKKFLHFILHRQCFETLYLKQITSL